MYTLSEILFLSQWLANNGNRLEGKKIVCWGYGEWLVGKVKLSKMVACLARCCDMEFKGWEKYCHKCAISSGNVLRIPYWTNYF